MHADCQDFKISCCDISGGISENLRPNLGLGSV